MAVLSPFAAAYLRDIVRKAVRAELGSLRAEVSRNTAALSSVHDNARRIGKLEQAVLNGKESEAM